jgi:hypothetical protein
LREPGHEPAPAPSDIYLEQVRREAAAAIALRDEAIAQRDTAIAQRDAAIEQIKREAAEQIRLLKQQHQVEIALLLRRFYGPRNERFDPAQILLFGDSINPVVPSPAAGQGVEDEAREKIALLPNATDEQKNQIRRDLRQQHSKPMLDKIKAWLDKESKLVLPRSPMAGAINYMLNQWQALCVYAEHGFLDIDNNGSERALKLIAIGRRNWLFVGNDQFGKHYATFYSLIASAKLHGLDPQAYLRHVLTHIMDTPLSELEQFLPDIYKARLQAQTAAGKAASPPGASPPANTSPPAIAPVPVAGPGP